MKLDRATALDPGSTPTRREKYHIVIVRKDGSRHVDTDLFDREDDGHALMREILARAEMDLWCGRITRIWSRSTGQVTWFPREYSHYKIEKVKS